MRGDKPKVFCIGWHKTGTSTMGEALISLGYTVVGARLDAARTLLEGKIDEVVQMGHQYEAYQDVPWAALYKELDRAFPGSKFILTERDESKWLNSAVKHFGRSDEPRPMFEWLYGEGVISGNEELFLERYRRHNREVKEYFKDRPDDFLIMDLEAGDAWEKLCPFLDHSVPEKAFPHSNKGRHSYTTKDKIVDAIRSAVPLPVRKFLFAAKLRLLKPFGYKDPRDKFNNHSQNLRELRSHR